MILIISVWKCIHNDIKRSVRLAFHDLSAEEYTIRTKVDHIKYFHTPILGHTGKKLPIGTSCDGTDRIQVSPIVLDELDALLLLLPELEMAINGRCNDKVRPDRVMILGESRVVTEMGQYFGTYIYGRGRTWSRSRNSERPDA